MASTITSEQITEQLNAIGFTSVPSFMIDAYLCKVEGIQSCLDAAGYDECDKFLIKIYAITLMVVTGYQQRIKSQSAASGASRSFDYSGDISALLDTLERMDTKGCTSGLPIDVGSRAGFFMVTKG